MNEFFFYDLETSGLNPRDARIMQFAGQRTDADFNPIGEPVNILVKLNDDTLPSPQAIMVTKITPQQTLADGITEAEFAKYVQEELFTPGTCILGYNSVRFDDEFMRALFWRNFYDPYTWSYADGRTRWDILDLVRMTRALRPEGITWPFNDKGHATNRLELITQLNGISHEHAHDALSDVYATIAVAKLIKDKQPKLFDYLYKMRDKREVQKLINLENKQPFVYTSGRYSAEYNKTTVAFPLAPARNGQILVFDLRHNLDDLLDKETFYPIVKTLAYNKCPAVAPLSVLDADDGWTKIGLSQDIIDKNLKSLLAHPEFAEQMREQDENSPEFPPAIDAESAIYDGFLSDQDRRLCTDVTRLDKDGLADYHPNFTDERLPELLLHYKARNFASALSESEQKQWEKYRLARLNRQATEFTDALNSLAENTDADEFIIEELNLWYQSLQPSDL
ncbi:exodeoxyribonuclease I [Candidatus Saccharibacteria bacterium]|nr:exodeoxyribonuclease I [Candidatus Saccharibacteria bacterium]